jgi:putative ABC transport system permease protein
MLGLAIGANTTIFSLLHAVLRPVSGSNPGRLVAISATDARTGQAGYFYEDPFTAFRAQQRSFSFLSMYSGGGILRVEARGTPRDVGIEGVTAEYFNLLGVRPEAGRLFNDADIHVSGDDTPVVIISDRLWQRSFGRDPRALDDTMTIEGKIVTIIGVTAPGFFGLQVDSGADLFLPITALRNLTGDVRRPVRSLNIIGQLAKGASLMQARTEALALWPGIQAAMALSSLSPAEQSALRSQRIAVESLATGFSPLRRQYGTSLVVLVSLTATLVAIGCVNLTGLLLARTIRRDHQIAIRLALGASRTRLFQQLLLEGLMLALCGLAASLPLAWWSSQALTGMLSAGRLIPLLRPMTPDWEVLAITTALTVFAGLLVSLLPAWRSVNGRVQGFLRPGRTIAASLGRSGRLLIVTQVALSLVLLVGAGLFTGTLSRLHRNDRSLPTSRIMWARLAKKPGDRNAMVGRTYLQELHRKMSEIRGVDAAALSFYFPAYLGQPSALPTSTVAPVSAANPSSDAPGLVEFISPGFFDLFGINRRDGRDFSWNDDGRAPPVAIVSESLSRKLFSHGEAIGRHVRVSTGSAQTDVEIVGVVADAPIGSIREPHQAVIFRPMLQDLSRAQIPLAHIRASDLNAVRDAYVRAVESQGYHFVRTVNTLDSWLDTVLLQERLIAGLSTSAAALAVLLTCIGIYSILAYAVTCRVREIGIRLALGATRVNVLQMFVREGLVLALPGVLIGIPLALAVARLVRSQLYGLTPDDPATIIGAVFAFTMTGLLATFVPALRASQINPIEALRHE